MILPASQTRFRDPKTALGRWQALVAALDEERQRGLQALLAGSADPDRVLHYLVELKNAHPSVFARWSGSPRALQWAVTLFSASRFLSEELLRHPDWLDELLEKDDLSQPRRARQICAELEAELAAESGLIPRPVTLARFRRRQILRIALRDLLGYATLAETTEELSLVADAILDACYRRIRAELERRYGSPQCPTPEGQTQACGFSILALGKLGGMELNYSSDIDLMFVYAHPGQTSGPEVISNGEFFARLANWLTDLLSTYTESGKCYRVDLRLRPEGRLGEVCVSVDAARRYYSERARDWELQMLIKARVCAGEPEPGEELLEFVQPLIYSSTLDFSAVESVSETRLRIHEKLASRFGPAKGINIKLAQGGIRDIEFLVQCLQRLHGGRELWLQHRGTLLALRRLNDKGFLSDAEYSRLASAYEFLRHLEHRLQLIEDRQTHVLPQDPDELEVLARLMPRPQGAGPLTREKLLAQLSQHLEDVQQLYERIIHSQQPIYYSTHAAPSGETSSSEGTSQDELPGLATSNLIRFLDQRAPGLASVLLRHPVRRNARAFEHFLEHVFKRPEWLGWLDSDPVLARHLIDLFEESLYFGEQLVRCPEWLAELKSMCEHPGQLPDFSQEISAVADMATLRRLFGRYMLRIQAESICLATPIFTTLRQTSELADAVIQAAYRIALEETKARQGPQNPAYEPVDQMVVVALGRLGMLEFDLASDADLVFVLPDRDAPELGFWTRVAERMITLITAYTGEGTIFAVDTRLRPNGREGLLVQTEASFKDYFAHQAEAWEGIAYMKSRAVAGNVDHGTEFLNELQQVDWRRWGQSGRSRRKLWEMRMRLEKEQGEENPLKAGYGGYYDIDFALTYLRLKSAGIFFKVLNTLERIDVLEKMGHLERSDAEFLRDAAVFYRALDHGLRVYSGHSGGRLPRTRHKLEALEKLVSRWTPEHLHDQPLDVELAQIRTRTREFFERLFAG